MSKLRAMQIHVYHEVKNSYFHYNVLKLKTSDTIKDPHLKFLLLILDTSHEGTASQLYLGPSFYFMKM